MGPVPEGRHKFVFTADPPNPAKIPVTDVVGVTVILITCAYRGQVIILFLFFILTKWRFLLFTDIWVTQFCKLKLDDHRILWNFSRMTIVQIRKLDDGILKNSRKWQEVWPIFRWENQMTTEFLWNLARWPKFQLEN